jgi:hypothetical protein
VKRFRKTSVATNPIGWIAGFYGVSVSHALSDNIAIRGDVNYINPIEDESTELWEVGVGMPLYLKRTFQGPFLEPGVIVRSSRETEYDGYVDSAGNWHERNREYTETTAGPQVLFGWHWTWDSGFNLAMAAGAGRNITESSNEDSYDGDEELFVNGYFRVGYAF